MEYVLNIIGVPSYGLKRAFAPLGVFGRHLQNHFIPHPRNNYHPHILGHRALALFSVLLLSAKIFTIALLAWGPIAPAFSSAITEPNIINLTNQSRVQYGEAALTENSELDKAAQAKADDMLARGYFAHVTPDGRTPWSFITAAGYNYLMAGENLAVNFTEAEDVETAWMNSPGHRANILNKDFVEIGIGVSQGQYEGHNAIFVVQELGTRGRPADCLKQPADYCANYARAAARRSGNGCPRSSARQRSQRQQHNSPSRAATDRRNPKGRAVSNFIRRSARGATGYIDRGNYYRWPGGFKRQ